ncbi:MAG: serine hydrolase, partial [Verrucomicrobiota bacterium]
MEIIFPKVSGFGTFLLAVFLCFWASFSRAEEIAFTNTIDHCRAAIPDVMDEYDIPGCSVVLVEGRRVAWAEGFGYANLEEQIPVTTDTVMMIGSVSKFLTAIMAAQLADEGALDLDASVTNSIPELTMQPRFEGTPGAWTPRNLLNHHAGLPGDIYNGLFGVTDYWPGYATWLLDYLRNDYPLYPPDMMASYGNSGFSIMGEVIARHDGVDFMDAAETRIFEPLGMTHSSFLPDKPTVAAQLATGYGDGLPQPTLICNTPSSGGAFSRPLDMAQIIKMVLADGKVDGEVFLSEERIADLGREADAPVKPGNLFRPGLGLDSVADPVMRYAGDTWLKSGDTGTFSALLLILPERQMGVFVNINISHPAAFLIARTILKEAILERDGLDSPGIAPMPEPEPTDWSYDELLAIEGHYITTGQVVRFDAETDGTLSVVYNAQQQSEPAEHWHPHENGRFFPLGQTNVQYAFANMGGRDVVLRYGSDGNMQVELQYGGYFEGILGERYDPPPVPDAWSNRLDRVWLADNIWHDDWMYQYGLQRLELSEGNGILALSGIADAVLEPNSDDVAFVGGLSTRGGGAVRSELDTAGHEVLWFSGYRFRALDELSVLNDAAPLAGNAGPHDNALFVYEPGIAEKDVVFMLSQDAGHATIALYDEDFERAQSGQGFVEYAATADAPVVLSVSSPEPVDFEIKAVDVTEVREAMRRTLIQYPDIPGFGVAAQEPGFPPIILTEGYARISPPSDEPSLPLQGDEQFHIASISKTYTAAAIFLLQQRDLLDIADGVTQHAPELNIPRGDEITIEMLLQHRSGLPVANDWFNGKLVKDPLLEFTVDEIVDVANWLHPDLLFDPGTNWSYTDTGYNILARVIENVSGMNYQAFIEDEVLMPLGLTNTFAPHNYQTEVPEPSVSSYMLINGDFQDRSVWNPSVEFGCGSIIATLEDLMNMTHAFFMTTDLLDEATQSLMMEKVSSTGLDFYGRGCDLAEGLGWGHDGTMWGTLSTARVDANNGVRVAAVMNGQYEDERLISASFAIRGALGLLKNAMGHDAGNLGQHEPMVFPILGPARQGKPFRYQPLAFNFPAAWNITGLPDGLDFDPDTGEISGTPSERGTFPLNLTAQNAYGQAEIKLDLEVKTGYANTIAAIREMIADMMEEEGAVGLSIALVDDQDIVWAEGFGYADREAGIPVTPDTVFRVGSISKVFTAAAALQYAERGLLDIAAPFTDYAPEVSWRPRYEETRPITTVDLMTHQSGLPGDLIRAASLTQPLGTGYIETLKDLAQTYPVLQPGTMTNYCNVGFILLQGVIEAAAAAEGDFRPFDQLVNDRLFDPLGMEATSYLSDKPAIDNQLAVPYVGGQRMPAEFIEGLGAGGMYSRPTDLAEFIKAVFAAEPRVLRKETFDQAMTDHSANAVFDAFASQKTGLGWDDVADTRLSYAGPSVWKAGDTMAYAGQLHLLPEKKLGVAISVNSPSNIPTTLDAFVLQHALLERDGEHWPTDTITYPTNLADISQAELDELAGAYVGPADYDLVEAHPGSLTYRRAVSYDAMTLENLQLRENGWFMSDDDPSQLIAFTNVQGRDIVLHRQNHGTYETHSIFSERFEPADLPAAWSKRLGKTWIVRNAPANDYLAVMGVPLELTLEYDHRGVLRVVTGGIPPIRVIQPETDELAWVPGIVNRGDSAVQIVDINGVEHILYGGYTFGPAVTDSDNDGLPDAWEQQIV